MRFPAVIAGLALLSCLLSLHVNAADYYWVNGSGNWSDVANHWATASGGSAFHSTVPDSTDDVYFDGNSFATAGGRVMQDLAVHSCRSMDWTGAIGNPTLEFNQQFKVYGDLILQSGMTFEATNSPQQREIHFLATGPADIDFQGATFQANNHLLIVNLEGQGDYHLRSDLEETSNGPLFAEFIVKIGASLTTHGHTFRASTLVVWNFVPVYLGTSNLYCDLNLGFTNSPLGDSATFYPALVLAYGQHDLHKVIFSGPGRMRSDLGAIRIGELIHGISAAPANELLLEGDISVEDRFEIMDSDAIVLLDLGAVLELDGDVIFHGTANQAIQLTGRQGVETLLRNGPDLCFEYVHITELDATGTATWIAGQGCLDLGGNTGFTFNSTPCSSVANDELVDTEVWTLGPNPVHGGGWIWLQAPVRQAADANLRIYDVRGKLIMEEKLPRKPRHQIYFPEVGAGLFLVEIATSGNVWRQKILVQN